MSQGKHLISSISLCNKLSSRSNEVGSTISSRWNHALKTMIGPMMLLFILGLVGCGSDSPHVVPVKGKVSYQGKPLTSGTVMLVPDGDGFGATGQIQPDGTFTLTSFKQNDGAAPGNYKVTVEVFPEATAGGPATGLPGMEFGAGEKPPIPTDYANVATTKLRALVNDGPTELDLQLED